MFRGGDVVSLGKNEEGRRWLAGDLASQDEHGFGIEAAHFRVDPVFLLLGETDLAQIFRGIALADK